MQTIRHAGALLLGALLAAALPGCSKRNAESPGNPPMGTETKTTPDTGGTGTAPAPPAAPPNPAAAGASPASGPAAAPAATPPPAGQQPGH
jgi:hypothetical protein